jgi:orotate phosphoribosyltransferase
MSDTYLGTDDLGRLRDLLERHSRLLGDFTLSSGIQSSYYFDSKRVLLHPEGLTLTGRILYPIVRRLGAEAVGGLQIGAIPLSFAIAQRSFEDGDLIPSFIVRDQAKAHGTKDAIAASFPPDRAEEDDEHHHVDLLGPGRKVVVVDDVVTTGDSLQKAVDAVKHIGCDVLAVLTLVTRPEKGGVAMAEEKWDNYLTVFESDLTGRLTPTDVAREALASATP